MPLNLTKQPLPAIYQRVDRDCYLDPVRKKLIIVTPEETVRQQVLSYLMEELKVPKEMLLVEEPLVHYGVSSRRRADIIINRPDGSGILRPAAVIECKGPGVLLGDRAAAQMADYCDTLGCDYGMMVNDSESLCYHYDEARNEYVRIGELPSYPDLLGGQFKPFDRGECPPRTPYSEISGYLKQNLDETSCDISYQTGHSLACAAFNLLEGLLDQRHRLPAGPYGMFTLLEDYGVRMLSYGNASGGVFNGLYRSFIIAVSGSTEFVSIGLSTYTTDARPDIVKTALNVAVDDEKASHHALQLILDDNVVYAGNVFDFYHHGRIAVGSQGSGKISELREFVRAKRPQLIADKRFFLGRLVNDRDWNLDDPEVAKLVENLISYALIRDEYRAYVKAKR